MMQRFLLLIIIWPLVSTFVLSDRIGNFYQGERKNNYVAKINVSEGEKCSDCHGDLIGKANVHAAAEDCESCHQIKISEHKDNAQKGLALAEKMPDLCYTCHDEIKKKIESSLLVHQAVNDKKACSICHSSHSSAEKKLLVASEKELCLSCHNKEMDTKSGKIMNMQKLLKTSKVEHAALADGCVACHNPHASNNIRLLNKAFPNGQYATAKKDSFALCFECHESGLLESATTTSATGFRNGEKNLHFVHINGEKGRSCTICHNVHASTNEHLIQPQVVFGSWEFKMNYKSDDEGGSCLPACHGEKKYIR